VNSKSAVALVYFLALVASSLASVRVGAELDRVLSSKADGEISVVFRFKSPALRAYKGLSQAQIIRAKRDLASRSQVGVLSKVWGSLLKNGASKIKKARSFWIDNSLALKAPAETIRSLLDHDEVLEVFLDSEIKLAQPRASRSSHGDSDELTYGLEKLRVAETWTRLGFNGAGVLVGILDTGVDLNHPELKEKVLMSRDFISDYEDNEPNDGHGHGTHCAATLGGGSVGGRAIGVAPGVNLIVGKVFSDGGATSHSKIIAGMQWMADPDGDPQTNDFPRVVSNSWATHLTDRFQSAVDTWVELGIIPVFGAGNTGSRPSTIGAPAAYPNVITVGATDFVDEIAEFSSRGPVNYLGQTHIKPNISAPGVDIYSARTGGGYRWMSGTSMATPHVAGVVALMLQADPDLRLERVSEILDQSALDLGAMGKDNSFGAGRVDALEALSLVLSGGRVELQVVGPDQAAMVSIEPGHRLLKTDPEGRLKVSLPAGDYQFTVTAYGYQRQTHNISVRAGITAKSSVILEQASRYMTRFQVLAPDGVPIKAWISFINRPIQGGSTEGSSLLRVLPQGRYKIQIKSVGYQSRFHEFSIIKDSRVLIKMKALPAFLVMDRDLNQKYEGYYLHALEALGLQADLLQEISTEDLMGYRFLIWFTGDQSTTSILSVKDQEALSLYVKSGGRVIISGQDLGLRIKGTSFYNQILGAKFLADVSVHKRIQGLGLDFRLNGGDSSGNQKWPDVIEVSSEAEQTAEVIFNYAGKGPAGILNSVGSGKIVYLPFGLEGVRDSRSRQAILRAVVERLRPSISDRLNRIEWAYKMDQRLYFLLLNQFKMDKENEAEIRLDLNHRSDKKPFRSLMGRLKWGD